jgi:hypothetical protein
MTEISSKWAVQVCLGEVRCMASKILLNVELMGRTTLVNTLKMGYEETITM